MNYTEEHIHGLVKDCKAGRERSRFELFNIFAPKVMGVCRRYSHSELEGEDIMQDIFIKVFSKIELFDPEKGSFGAWLYRISVNTTLKHIKKNHRHALVDSLDSVAEEATDHVYIDDAVNEKELLQLLDELPLNKKIIFNLYAIEGYSHKEIADQLSITESTSRSQFTRAKKMLGDLYLERNRVEDTTLL